MISSSSKFQWSAAATKNNCFSESVNMSTLIDLQWTGCTNVQLLWNWEIRVHQRCHAMQFCAESPGQCGIGESLRSIGDFLKLTVLLTFFRILSSNSYLFDSFKLLTNRDAFRWTLPVITQYRNHPAEQINLRTSSRQCLLSRTHLIPIPFTWSVAIISGDHPVVQDGSCLVNWQSKQGHSRTN